MEYAISIYKGSKRVYAKDCDFVSYSVEGLICPICKQEVYLRKGDIREPYFAHFHATSSRQVEECELRVSTDGNSTEISSLIENRGQRLEIFQQHFLSMICVGQEKIVNDVEFKKWIDLIKQSKNLAINNITNNCIDYFLTHRRIMKEKYILTSSKIEDKRILLQHQIALEAIDYLCVKSSSNLLQYIINYSIYQLFRSEKDKLFGQDIRKNNIVNICDVAAKLVLNNFWIKEFQLIQNKQYKHKIYSQKDNNHNNINIKAGYIDGWSNTFTVQLAKGDYLAIQLGYGLITLEAFHTNNTLSLFQAKNKILNKIIDFAKIEITYIPTYEWIATKFHYEHLADLLNKCGNIDAKTASNYIGLLLTDETLSIQDRVLCTKKTLGEKILIKTHLNSDFLDKNNKVKDSCRWLDQIRIKLTAKMLQPNAPIIAQKLDNSKLSTEKQQKLSNAKRANHNLRTLLRTVEHCIKPFVASSDIAAIKELNHCIAGYMMSSLKLSRYDIIATCKALNQESYNQLLSKARQYYDSKDGGFNETKLKKFANTHNKENDWVLLSQRANTTETTIVAMNSAKYHDCVLMYKLYKLELNERGNLDTPQWLEHTLARYGVNANDVLGYVGVRYPNGSIDKLGIIHWHSKKNKTTGEISQQLWYTALASYSKNQINLSVETGKDTLKMITKYHYKDNVLTKVTVPTYVKQLAATTAIEKIENTIDSDLAMFMSLYGISHNSPVKPGKLSTINNESKYINVNWSSLIGHKVAPMNKNNEVLWHPKFSCPYTLVK